MVQKEILMTFIKLHEEERLSGQLAPETLKMAVNQVRLNGFTVLEGAVSVDLVDQMNQDLLQVIDDALKTHAEKTELNTSPFRKNRIRMDLPFREPYINSQIITNPFAMAVIEQILGDDCRMFYLSVDAPMPGSDYQTVHGDYAPFFPESDVIMPTAGLVVNYPLVNVTEQNGPLEVWPNTHLTPERYYVGNHVQEAVKALPPTRMLTPKGSLIIRDVRMWHRGTPNVSNEIRPNVALIYGRSWWDGAFYPQETLGITAQALAGLPARAKHLFRFEPVQG
jgi:ectoine hydroxylase-related dioxygenase (phytanoyl-CoA dioxygenase family)